MKKLLSALLSMLIVISGCAPKGATPAHLLLGAGDDELSQSRGEGQVSKYTAEGKEKIQMRRYAEEMFGMDATVEFMYSDEQKVSQIVATFGETDEEKLVNAVSYHLEQQPVAVQNESEEFDFSARWEKDGIIWTAGKIPASALYVMIEKK